MARHATYRPWTDAELADVRARAERGDLAPAIARALGRTPSSVRAKLGALGEGAVSRARRGLSPFTLATAGATAPDAAPDVAEWRARRDAAVREVSREDRLAEVFDWLRPVELPAPVAPKARLRAAPRTLVLSDPHFGCHDEAALEVVIQTIAAVRPERLLLNGDVVDLLALSRYPKDARRGRTWTLRDEVAALHAFLHRVESLGAAWGMAVEEVDDSNHSGNTPRGRWWRYLSDRCPELLQHDEAETRLGYAAWFYPTWSRIRLVPPPVLPGGLLVEHGEIVRKHGGYSARAHGERWLSSVMHGHTHRIGSSVRRVPAVGDRPEGVIRTYENGCLCRLGADYAPAADWSQGFAIVTHDTAAEEYGVEQVVINRGRAVVNAAGGLIAA